MSYLWQLRGILVSCKYLAIMYEVGIAVGCILVDMCKNVGTIQPFSLLAV